MKVFVAGATGVLGHRLVERLADGGHEVVGLVRDDRGEELVRERGGQPAFGDVLEPDSLVEAAEGADVVVHAATAIPTATKPSREAWERNDEIRRVGTANLLDAVAAVGADRFVLQSVVWAVRRDDGGPIDEESAPNPDRTTRSALDAERLVEEAAGSSDLEHCVLRGGWFYAHDAAHTRQFGEGLLDRRMPVIGRGLLGRKDATLSYLHADDAASAFATAAEGDATGVYHVVDDQPATLATFLRTFAEKLEAPAPRRVPAWLARPLIGADAVRLLATGMPTSNERFTTAFDWDPTHATYADGIEQIVREWESDGTVRSTADGYEWHGED